MSWYDPEAASFLAARQLAEEARQRRREGDRRRPRPARAAGRPGPGARRPTPLPPARSAPDRYPVIVT
ncbi:hypothetical protein [Modestobacter italicus]|uniref:hypothetical protein n=1 Tax=Modestobacter italicus (strain DSM 44449 / CECT 9708 / BC 501) TaxID=2732864 RepID=UPI001C97E999|nr:hypothetical protein [Modestobacter italicus]